MKKIIRLISMFVLWTVKEVFHVFRIPLIIIGIALLAGVFSRKIMLCILLIDFGAVVTAMPAVFTARKLLENIMIVRNGEKFSGTCTGYKFERWNCGYDVHWLDENNMEFHRRFDVLMIKLKFPFTVNVYVLNRIVNLGIFTIIKNIIYFAVCFFMWVGCIGITFNNIYNIFAY